MRAGPGVIQPVPYTTLWPQSTANNTYNATFVFSTGLYNSTGAESFCRRQGGHLASFRSYDEQLEVEEFFINSVRRCLHGCFCDDVAAPVMQNWGGLAPGLAASVTEALRPASTQGYLLPSFHNNYWIGLAVKAAWPVFKWLDPFSPGPFPSTYRHWGIFLPDLAQEPFSGNGAHLQLPFFICGDGCALLLLLI